MPHTPAVSLKRGRSMSPSVLPETVVPLKRRRHSTVPLESRVEPADVFRRSDEFWLDDGNILLQAEDLRFKVHRSVIMMHSSFLKNAIVRLKIKPNDPRPIRLERTAKEVEHMIRAIYCTGSYFNRRQPMTVEALSALLRTGTAYDIPVLHREAVQRLQLSFPSHLAGFDRALAEKTASTLIVPYRGFFFDLINLAHEAKVPSVLPALYYLGCKKLNGLLYGYPRPDGTVARLLPALLPAAIAGRAAFLRTQAARSFTWLFDTYDDIPDCVEDFCADSRREVLRRILPAIPDTVMGLSRWVMPPAPLCDECVRRAKEVHEGERQKLWEQLPTLLGMAPWDRLREQEN
ncbi:hypothetical protein PUNSTDRAFT_124108 [Punctularia strigosozonata HHB-11173 SS5]|uniref:uncharacterized protein n=1 Tax=Punctularia strigosozonata (strain HHB-11173) TaxID=741275 RepID=UPI0004417A24|nr:uncharacterized protein PUNSTDRAFT_124108 [Punctularia strigosozonata HHB-11173 SS5]EIN14661.1 hypothetical protein PUNSTDRAFT_124108 [Punctularia strigosozonata HHB-11173 SS5]